MTVAELPSEAPADGGQDLADAVHTLRRRHPRLSAHCRVTAPQRRLFLVLAAAGLIGSLWQPGSALALAVGSALGLQLGTMVHRWLLVGVALAPSGPPAGAASESILPCYSILVPLFREAAVLPHLVQALGALDYPPERLDIILVLEADDETTCALAAQVAPAHFRMVRVPSGLPRTKPKALNYALPKATGSFLVVYDGEDRPAPDQLRAALAGFAAAPHLACLQAPLNFWNRAENWLTRVFALEYAVWFDLMLPGLHRLGAPFPLGGTSNHFRTQVLRDVGGWDPFNVTEDADLGLRLHRLGYRVGLVSSTTYEEAPWQLGNWMRQRSRWMKGYVQTLLVHGRDLPALRRQAGLGGCLQALLAIGGTIGLNLINPILLGLGLCDHLLVSAGQAALLPAGLGRAVAFGNVAVGLSLVAMTAWAGRRRGWADAITDALSVPVYWLLMSLATYCAMAELIYRPFHWHKTEHGVTRLVPGTAGPAAAPGCPELA